MKTTIRKSTRAKVIISSRFYKRTRSSIMIMGKTPTHVYNIGRARSYKFLGYVVDLNLDLGASCSESVPRQNPQPG